MRTWKGLTCRLTAPVALLLEVAMSLSDAAAATSTAQINSSGDGVEIQSGSESESWRETIPVYREGESRYFSAGIGRAEREALAHLAPAFSLKIVLTTARKAFLAHVDVQLVRSDGGLTLDIPAERVTGPWLYVDVPAGTYDIVGRRDGETVRLRMALAKQAGVQTAYVRFADEAE